MVGTAGFEPATSASRTLRATKLRHVPSSRSLAAGRPAPPGRSPRRYREPVRIAQVCPPWLSVPPKGYGGIEWIVSLLADGLVDAGHDVTLFASGDSETRAKLEYVVEEAPGSAAINDIALDATHTMF